MTNVKLSLSSCFMNQDKKKREDILCHPFQAGPAYKVKFRNVVNQSLSKLSINIREKGKGLRQYILRRLSNGRPEPCGNRVRDTLGQNERICSCNQLTYNINLHKINSRDFHPLDLISYSYRLFIEETNSPVESITAEMK